MITIGAFYNGPEFSGSPIQKLEGATSQATVAVCGKFEDRVPSPWINVVFNVPGSLGDFGEHEEIEVGRYSRKQNLLLLPVLVSEEAKAAPSVAYVVDILRRACAIASDVFARKGIKGFDLAKAEALIERMKPLIEERFAAFLAGEWPKSPLLFYNYDPAALARRSATSEKAKGDFPRNSRENE